MGETITQEFIQETPVREKGPGAGGSWVSHGAKVSAGMTLSEGERGGKGGWRCSRLCPGKVCYGL